MMNPSEESNSIKKENENDIEIDKIEDENCKLDDEINQKTLDSIIEKISNIID